MKVRILLALVATMVASSAQAGFMIDPYIGIGQTKTELDVAGDNENTSSDTYFGSRVGYSFILVSAGIDYQITKGEDSDGDDANLNSLSAFVGVDLPILFRFWAEYFLSSSFDSDTDGVDFTFKDGYSVGIGFTGLPFVSINLELQAMNYEAEFDNFPNNEFDLTVGSTILSVSLPLDF